MPSIAEWSEMPKDSIGWALSALQEAHFKTFNAFESQTAKRARNSHADALRVLEHAFNHLWLQYDLPIYSKQSEMDADKWDAEYRLRKLAARLNPEQFISVDVGTLQQLLSRKA